MTPNQSLIDLPPAPATPPPVDTAALRHTAGRGALWRIGGGIWSTGVRLGASMFLARHLAPDDFGIVGMAILAREFTWRIGGLGMGSGVVAKKDLTQEDLSTAFWTDATVRIVLFAILFLAAPAIAVFFQTPAVTWVIRAVSLTFVLSAFSSVSGTLLYRRMQFGAQEGINALGATVESGLAVALVLWTPYHYWSLVIAMLASAVLTHGLTILLARWRPHFHFNRKSFRFQFRFGAYGLGSSLVDYIDDNIDYIIVGRFFGKASLGLYEFAFRIPTMLHSRLIRPAAGVLFPALSRAQSHPDLVGRGFLKVTRLSAILVWPLLAILAAMAWQIVYVLWGAQWLPIVPLLRILCIVAALNSVCSVACPTFPVMHRPDLPLKLAIPKCVMSITLVILLGMEFGLIGVATGMAINSCYYFFVAWRITKLCHLPYRRLLRSLAPPLVTAAVGGLAAFAATRGILWAGASFLASLPVGLAGGLLAVFLMLCFVFRDNGKEIVTLIQSALGKHPAHTKADPAAAQTPASTIRS